MNYTEKLGDIAQIQSGYSFRGPVRDEGNGLIVVQAKDIEQLAISENNLSRLGQEFSETKLLSDGDVLLSSRGSFRSAVAHFGEPAIASASLFVIRLQSNFYLPEFLALYLNSNLAQNHLHQAAKGATIQSVNIADIVNLHVPKVPLGRQRVLVGLHLNIEAQTTLLHSKLNVLNEIYTGAISRSLKGVA